MKEKEEVFTYEYTARQQKEIREIREKYRQKPDEASPMERLRRLDAGVTQKGTCISVVAGALGCLVLGVGMSCVTVWGAHLFFFGILVGIVGLTGIIGAYPLYAHITRKERERLAPEILRLAEELLQ